MRYRLRILDWTVDFPKGFQTDYDDLEKAYEPLSNFVHQYDGKLEVTGTVEDMEHEYEDIEWVNSDFDCE